MVQAGGSAGQRRPSSWGTGVLDAREQAGSRVSPAGGGQGTGGGHDGGRGSSFAAYLGCGCGPRCFFTKTWLIEGLKHARYCMRCCAALRALPQDLPADLLEAHRAALARPLAGGQSEEELRGIIDQARTRSCRGQAGRLLACVCGPGSPAPPCPALLRSLRWEGGQLGPSRCCSLP